MIDRNTGSIEVAHNKVIIPSISLEGVQSMGVGEGYTERDMNNGWVWHDMRNVKLGDQYFNISLAFYNNKLNTITLVFSKTKHGSKKESEPWSENEELQKAVIFNNWLYAEVGTERTFNWGEAWAGYDPKGGFSSVVIKYKN